MKKKSKEEIAIIGALIFVLSISIVIYFSDIELGSLGESLPELIVADDITDFQRFGLLVEFAYSALPTIAQQFSIGAISTQLLLSGIDPLMLMAVATVGLTLGHIAIYIVGLMFKKFHHGIKKGGFGDIAGKNHFLHKYHYLIYIIVAFTGILGDAIMLYTGYKRVNLLKILPFLLIGDFISTARWVYPTMAQLEISKLFGG